jgi:hypothetical protein
MGFLVTNNPAAYVNIGNIAICYYSKYCAGLPSSTIPNNYISTYNISASSGSLTEVIKSTCLAYYNPTSPSDPTNKSTLDQLTTQFGTDYSNFKKATFDFTLAGIAAIAPNALTDVIEWKYISENKACYTRAYSYPLNWTVVNLAHYDYTNDCTNSTDTGQPNWDGQPYRYYYGPPGQCSGSQLQLTRYGLLFADGRLTSKFISTDSI